MTKSLIGGEAVNVFIRCGHMSGRRLEIEELQAFAVKAQFMPAKLADLCLLSTRQLQRIFQREFRKSPGEWLRESQCQLAKELVSEGYSNKAIAAKLSFANGAHFCREFKKIFKTTPQSLSRNSTTAIRSSSSKMSLMDNHVANGQSIPIAKFLPM